MNKVYALSPEEFSIKVQAHALQVKQMGAIRAGFQEPKDLKTKFTVEKLQQLDESLPAVLGDSMPNVVTGYFKLYRDAVEHLDGAGTVVPQNETERANRFGEVAVCMFIIKELEMMGIN
jgi:hypothetical protein